jgi:hypothetical protein
LQEVDPVHPAAAVPAVYFILPLKVLRSQEELKLLLLVQVEQLKQLCRRRLKATMATQLPLQD